MNVSKRPRGISRRRTAFHEAGHAVMTHLMGAKVSAVTVEYDPSTEALGTSHWQGSTLSPTIGESSAYPLRFLDVSPSERLKVEKRALISLAGNAAESILTSHHRLAGSGPDFHNAVEYVSLITSGDDDELRKYVDSLWYRARNVLRWPCAWRATEALAKELLKSTTLGGARARSIIQSEISRLS